MRPVGRADAALVGSLLLISLRHGNDLSLIKVVDLIDQVIRDEFVRRDLLLGHTPFLHEVDIGRIPALGILTPL